MLYLLSQTLQIYSSKMIPEVFFLIIRREKNPSEMKDPFDLVLFCVAVNIESLRRDLSAGLGNQNRI